MAANKYAPAPANKVYYAANGHKMEIAPSFSKHSGWYFVYSNAWHHDSCPCKHWTEGNGYNVGEYAGESE
jgi:hypothetical protein